MIQPRFRQRSTKRGAAREGIVFVPAGRYRLTRTVYLWPGVRVIGYGATRPVFLLAPNTPGFQKGMGVMVMFTGLNPAELSEPRDCALRFRRRTGAAQRQDCRRESEHVLLRDEQHRLRDRRGQPGAVAMRFHVAQHSFLSHMDFHIGSGLAALNQVGNEAEDLHFFGGRYGILTEKTSPAWQFTLIDSTFDGQREAAIREHEAGSR